MIPGVIGDKGTSVPGKTGFSNGELSSPLSPLDEASVCNWGAGRGKSGSLSLTFFIVSRPCLYACSKVRHIPDIERTAERMKIARDWKEKCPDDLRRNGGRASFSPPTFASDVSGTEVCSLRRRVSVGAYAGETSLSWREGDS